MIINSQSNAQLRKNLPKPLILNYFRVLWQRVRGVRVSKHVFLFSGVELLRYPKSISLGSRVIVKTGAHLCVCNENALIKIGARTSIGFYSFLYASSQISIGDDCMIAPFVYIVDSDHGIKKGICMNQQPNHAMPIVIGNDVWVGAHSVILSGVEVGDGAIIASGAVVRESVPPNTIVGGVPAKILGVRK